MKWSWRIGSIAGIDLRVHVTFLLLLGWVPSATTRHGKAPTIPAEHRPKEAAPAFHVTVNPRD